MCKGLWYFQTDLCNICLRQQSLLISYQESVRPTKNHWKNTWFDLGALSYRIATRSGLMSNVIEQLIYFIPFYIEHNKRYMNLFYQTVYWYMSSSEEIIQNNMTNSHSKNTQVDCSHAIAFDIPTSSRDLI